MTRRLRKKKTGTPLKARREDRLYLFGDTKDEDSHDTCDVC